MSFVLCPEQADRVVNLTSTGSAFFLGDGERQMTDPSSGMAERPFYRLGMHRLAQMRHNLAMP